jgi:hypothetical protein
MKNKEKNKKCIAEVSFGDWGRCRQCKNNASPGSDYCWLHDPERIKKEDELRDRTYEEKQQDRREQHLRNATLIEMAEGIETKDLRNYKLILKDGK